MALQRAIEEVLENRGATELGIPYYPEYGFTANDALNLLGEAWRTARQSFGNAMPVSPTYVDVYSFSILCSPIEPEPVPEPQPLEIITDSLDAKFPCVKNLVINQLFDNLNLWTLITVPFMSSESFSPKLIWNANPQLYGDDQLNTYSLGTTQASGYSSTIELNSLAIQSASRLYIATTVIHETTHAYVNYVIGTGKYGEVNVDTYSWGASIKLFNKLDSLYQDSLKIT